VSAFDELVEDEHEPCALLMDGLLRALSGGNSLWFSMRYPFLLEVRDLLGRQWIWEGQQGENAIAANSSDCWSSRNDWDCHARGL